MPRKRPPARTPEERRDQIISAAYDLAEKKIADGTASSQLLVYLIKSGTEEARLERDILAAQHKLINAKTENLETLNRLEELYTGAVNAMKRYNGDGGNEEDNQNL